MNNSKTAPKAHSEEYFGEYRDYWWNLDFLHLIKNRLKMDKAKTVLDVGCGIGHWGQLISPLLSDDAKLIGIDREEAHLIRAADRAHRLGLSSRFQYQKGDANSLPFSNDSFDMVTCQTVMIHLKSPKHGLSEMLRVLKPGGLLLVAEPNNFANRAVGSSLTEHLSVDQIMDRLKFNLLIERGKKALGLGFNSEGDLIPGYLAALGAQEIRIFQSDKAVPFVPPYSTAEEQVNIRQIREWAKREFVGWDRDEMKEYFIAGGGDSDRFDYYWKQSLQDFINIIKGIDEGTYSSAGGGISYLISARK